MYLKMKIRLFHLETLNHCKKETWNSAIKNAISLDNSNNIIDIDITKINVKNLVDFYFN